MRKVALLVLIMSACISYAAPAKKFIAGKDYQLIQVPATYTSPVEEKPGTVLVQEFFSYGCPWCFRLEPTLEQWLKNKPKDIEFQRVPVVFENGWQTYSRAYFTAEALGITKQITPMIFTAIHKNQQDLTSLKAIQNFFLQQGVRPQEFNSVFLNSPTINIELKQANQMMSAYKVYEIPTIVVAQKYKTTLGMTKGNEKRLIEIVNYLIEKAKKDQHKSGKV